MKLKIILFAFFSIVISTEGKSQIERFKAVYVYSIYKNIVWPDNKIENSEFIIYILGNSPLARELNIIAKKRRSVDKKLIIKSVSKPEDIKNCHLIYIPNRRSYLFSNVKDQFTGKPTLILADKLDMCKKGADLNYAKNESGGIELELNKVIIKNKGMSISHSLLSASKIVK